ncbi:uncharacterized protein PHALS_14746 [Plasmopara halstedii]|uniref:Uncharacterized protein n=1 Tax=Plasmopara halstedii TaxID=4781 RepID=A0A0P1ARJ4_PLAHL|nr:uncharacterized protein PHALS_14746 [Plasmopara halstedii]CEG43821.1 hypothetical protein PHALS_14746 [Plasmopara halstedii]|eukprot:XP_024580190.1 hypothetical protein PHALS_14746 [Plasmopara halstedii]
MIGFLWILCRRIQLLKVSAKFQNMFAESRTFFLYKPLDAFSSSKEEVDAVNKAKNCAKLIFDDNALSLKTQLRKYLLTTLLSHMDTD